MIPRLLDIGCSKRWWQGLASAIMLLAILFVTPSASEVSAIDKGKYDVEGYSGDAQAGYLGCNLAWRAVAGPNHGAMYNLLAGVEAIAPDNVWAVGSLGAGTLVEHWDGTQWAIIPSPSVGSGDNSLVGISAVSPNDIWAVGWYNASGGTAGTLTVHWDGSTWTLVNSPGPGPGQTRLFDVLAIASNDVWAVGESGNQTLILHWNGSVWTQVTSPSPGAYSNSLSGIAGSGPNDIWAVGYFRNSEFPFQILTLHWDGTNWTNVPSTPQMRTHFLYGISMISQTDTWAVGTFINEQNTFDALTMHWDGSTWTEVVAPNPGTSTNRLDDVEAISATDVWASGTYYDGAVPLLIHWNGTQWSQAPSSSTMGALTDLSALASDDIWAVGDYYSNGYHSLIEHYSTDCPVGTPTSAPSTSTPTRTNTAVTPTRTRTPLPSSTPTVTNTIPPTQTPGGPTATPILSNTSTSTATLTPIAAPTSTPCALTFADVPVDHAFYSFIRCLACRGIISGYSDGTFKPGNDITRGQIAKAVSNSAGFSEDPGSQIYEDVPVGSPFYAWVNRLSMRGHMGGYPCGLVPEEPCLPPNNRPYFRPNANATRGQLAKIVSNAAGLGGDPTGLFYTDVPEDHTFYAWIMRLTQLGVMSGYPCGLVPEEPCDDANRPYFRPFNNVTRGQASKIAGNTFFPNCDTPFQR
ncbi:MAG TPA: S-layer homology domain-containing protein [Chloroflexia bacterium]|nr:S-layer homology domain-containing protein [Chloroflexia bacterium]